MNLDDPNDNVDSTDLHEIPDDYESIRILVQWTSKQHGLICDLELSAFVYDERARFSERIDTHNRKSRDGGVIFVRDIESNDSSRSKSEMFRLNLNDVSPSTTAVLLSLDGGPRNFQFLQSVGVQCNRASTTERTYGNFLPKEESETSKNGPLFQVVNKTRKSYKGLILGLLYKDGWNQETETARWVMKLLFEPVFVSSNKDKLEQCAQLVIGEVPALEKFRPRMFGSIRELCAALSSHTLPKLKKKFLKNPEGLPIGQFTDVLFKQLFETHPKILEPAEAPYTVAMLQEMFHQIDYNGDGTTTWDEFTTFCIQTGLNNMQSNSASEAAPVTSGAGGYSGYALEQYVIEYGEEVLHRDHILSAYRFIAQMRHAPDIKKLLIIQEDSDHVLILDEKFRMHAQLYPSKVQVIGAMKKKTEADTIAQKAGVNFGNGGNDGGGGGNAGAMRLSSGTAAPRVQIYDALYLTGRDMYCFTASDHSITICKELSSVNGSRVTYLLHNRFYHTLLHLKLCWSEKHDLLCSTSSDRVIYGWNIDTGAVIFQVARHTDIITDFIAVDSADLFITSSMDKRIVMWSAVTRRVKGVFLGHKRGVRSISVYENTLLSAGFECEAKTWDLNTRDQVAVLKGHRQPIVAAKLMCDRAQSDKEYRAITVDESGEFRLWSIYVRERGSEPVHVPTIQIFEMQNPESPLNQFRFLILPYNQRCSTSYYSNLIACSTKLFHFVPEKNTKEFIPPTACVSHEGASLIVTAIGKNLLLYDLSAGHFSNIFEAVASNDIVSICMDGDRGRRMFVGTSAGQVLLVNSNSGAVIDCVQFHSKEVTDICQRNASIFVNKTAMGASASIGGSGAISTANLNTAVYNGHLFSCSMDGHLRMYEESGGKLHLQNTVDSVFGEGIGLSSMRCIPSINALVVCSAGKIWGILHDITLKKLMIMHEEEVVTAIEVIGSSRDKYEEEMTHRGFMNTQSQSPQKVPTTPVPQSTTNPAGKEKTSFKESLLTMAIATGGKVIVYVIDIIESRGVKVFELHHDTSVYINNMSYIIRFNDVHSLNYSSIRASQSNLSLMIAEYHKKNASTNTLSSLAENPADEKKSSSKAKSGKSKAPANGSNKTSTETATLGSNDIASQYLLAVTDDNRVVIWDTGIIRSEGEQRYRFYNKTLQQQQSRENTSHSHGRPPNNDSPLTIPGNNPLTSPQGLSLSIKAPSVGNMQMLATSAAPSPLHRKQGLQTPTTAGNNSTTPFFSTNSSTSSRPGTGHLDLSSLLPSGQTSWIEGQSKDIFPIAYLSTNSTNFGSNNGTSGFAGMGQPLSRQSIKMLRSSSSSNLLATAAATNVSSPSDKISVPGSNSISPPGKMRRQVSVNINTPEQRRTKLLSNIFGGDLSRVSAKNLEIGLNTLIPSCSSFNAHNDNIPRVMSLMNHGCFVTVSHDGYHRLWNIDNECLGELPLPNLTESMKLNARCTEPGTQWKFILERIPVTKTHVDFANHLVRIINSIRFPNDPKYNPMLSRGVSSLGVGMSTGDSNVSPSLARHNFPVGFKGFRETNVNGSFKLVNDNDDRSIDSTTSNNVQLSAEDIQKKLEQDKLRKGVLKSLSEPPKLAELPPPSRLPTKEEKELIRLALIMNTHNNNSVSSPTNFASQIDSNLNSNTFLTASIDTNTIATNNTAELQQGSSSLVIGEEAFERSISKSAPNTGTAKGKNVSPSRAKTSSSSTRGGGNNKMKTSRSVDTLAKRNANQLSPTQIRQQRQLKQAQTALQQSLMYNSEKSSVCLAGFGVPSLWIVPGERDIFGKTVPLSSQAAAGDQQSIPAAFSEASIMGLHRDGLIDEEGHRILRSIASKPDRVQVYDRSQPTLLLRNTALSTNVTLPPLDSISKSEIAFGAQKEMYKNAEKEMAIKDTHKTQIRSAVACARVEANVRKIKSMIHLIEPPSHDEVILPKHSSTTTEPVNNYALSGNAANQSGNNLHELTATSSNQFDTEHLYAETRHKLRLMKSASLVSAEALSHSRPLDRQSIEKWMLKMSSAMGGGLPGTAGSTNNTSSGISMNGSGTNSANSSRPTTSRRKTAFEAPVVTATNIESLIASPLAPFIDYHSPLAPIHQKLTVKKKQQTNNNESSNSLSSLFNAADKKHKRKREMRLSQAAIAALERKLAAAIKGEYKARVAKYNKRKQMIQKIQQEHGATEVSEIEYGITSLSPYCDEIPTSANGMINSSNTGSNTSTSGLGLTSPPQTAGGSSGNLAFNTAYNSNSSNNISGYNIINDDQQLEEEDEMILQQELQQLQQNQRTRASFTGMGNKTSTTGKDGTNANGGGQQFTITTRQLLPHYKLDSVHQFMDIFAKVDENFSGDLDVNEWIKLFTSLNESVSEQEARMIFMKIDKDGDGILTMRELIPVVFSKAKKDQQKLIIQYAELELTKKVESETIPRVTSMDLEFLFEAYDIDSVGFVDVNLIKDRIKAMQLPQNCVDFMREFFNELQDDDMLNLVEFKRLLKPFTSNK